MLFIDTTQSYLYAFLTVLIFISILPIVWVVIESLAGRIDIFVSDRRKRTKFFIPALISYLAGLFVSKYMHDRVLATYHLSYFIMALSLLILSFKWKASIHVAGAANPITFLILLKGIYYAPLYILLIPVIWCRHVAKAHNAIEFLIGLILALISPFLAFQLIDYILIS